VMIKSQWACFVTLSALLLTTFSAYAEDPRRQYNEPTRGFFLEHGRVSGQGKVSAELHTGSDDVDAGGGIRLGLSNAELIVNSGATAYSGDELMLKWGLNDAINRNNEAQNRSKNQFDLALIAALSHVDNEDANGQTTVDQTNVKLGAAATVDVDAATFTLAPSIVYVDGNIKEDTFVTVDLGGYVGIIDTPSGLFSVGVEALFTTEDNADHSFAIGGRWAYNDRVNLDFVPFVFSEGNRVGLPGIVRLNIGL
jgi:hypothetical protein